MRLLPSQSPATSPCIMYSTISEGEGEAGLTYFASPEKRERLGLPDPLRSGAPLKIGSSRDIAAVIVVISDWGELNGNGFS